MCGRAGTSVREIKAHELIDNCAPRREREALITPIGNYQTILADHGPLPFPLDEAREHIRKENHDPAEIEAQPLNPGGQTPTIGIERMASLNIEH